MMLVFVTRDEFTFATQFLPRPYLVKGYKLNMRRYMIAVCTGGRLRGYVHDDGKNIYTKNPYVEPWTVKAGKGKDGRATELDLLKGRLDDLITTGYVPPTHYDDKVPPSLPPATTLSHAKEHNPHPLLSSAPPHAPSQTHK